MKGEGGGGAEPERSILFEPEPKPSREVAGIDSLWLQRLLNFNNQCDVAHSNPFSAENIHLKPLGSKWRKRRQQLPYLI